MSSYLDIALRVAGPPHCLPDKQKSAEGKPCPIPAPAAPLREVAEAENLAACGSPHCAGCYDVGDGKKIHRPKIGEDYRRWLEHWKPKEKPQ
jgi:hypothetical protein